MNLDGTTLYRIALGNDRCPDQWQLVLATEAWPRVLVAPTGSGKTAAVTPRWAAHRLRCPNDTPCRVIRCKDLDDFCDPDLTGFDLDVSPYVRDAEVHSTQEGVPRCDRESCSG